MTPAISVVLPAFNAAPYLETALQSVLTQSFGDFELLIIDDASTDRTLEIAQSTGDKRVRVLQNETNRGVSLSLNHGLESARGDFIARMDADDICHAARFERQIEVMEADAQILVCGSWATDIDGDGQEVGKRITPFGPFLKHFWWRPSPLIHPSVMWRASGECRYNASLRCAQDFDLWLQLGFAGQKFHNIAEALLRYRVHEGSVTAQNGGRQLEQTWESFVRHSGLPIARETFFGLCFVNLEVEPRLRTRAMRQIAARLGQKYGYWHLRDDARYRLWRLKRAE